MLDYEIEVLNLAGPRASKEPEVGAFVREVLDKTWPIGFAKNPQR